MIVTFTYKYGVYFCKILGLSVCAADAYLLFQDLVQLVNADQPYWLIGMTEMTRTFGLELLESVLTQYSQVFYKVKTHIYLN